MAVGPIQVAAIAGFRSAGPFVYANPFGGGLLSWIGNPDNEWSIISYFVAGLIACSAVWLIDGALTFFESRMISATLALAVFIGLLLVLAEGGKFDPTRWREIIAASLFGLAYMSTCGRVFSRTEDQKDKKNK
ncbi:MAG: hypothetical protein ACR2QF_00905 [Geminicoccaceae bacterium]